MRSAIPAGEPARVLAGVPLFAGLDRVALAKLAAHFERVRFEPGEIVFREGDPGDAFYVVLVGTFSDFVGAPDTGMDRRLAATGSTFGDIALLWNRPRCDDRACRRGGRGAPAGAGQLLGLVAQEPAVALAIAAALSERVWRANVRGVRTVETREAALSGDGAALDADAVAGARGDGGTAAPSRTGGGGRARPRDPRPGVADPAARGARAERAGLRSARSARWCRRAGAPAGGTPRARGDIALWTLAGVAPARVGLAGFATPSWVLVVAVLCFGGALASTGLVYRIALAIVARARGRVRRPGRRTRAGGRGARAGGAERDRPRRPASRRRSQELIEALGYAARLPPGGRPGAGGARGLRAGWAPSS